MKLTKREAIWVAIGALALICFYLVAVLSFWFYSKDRIYPGVTVAGVALSGKTKAEAETILKAKVAEFSKKEINISGEKPQKIAQNELGVKYGVKESVKQAHQWGNRNPFVLGTKKELPLQLIIDDEVLFKTLSGIDNKTKTTITNSRLEKKGTEIEVIDGKAGKRINYAETTENLFSSLSNMDSEVELATFTVNPTFEKKDLEKIKPEIGEKTSSNFLIKNGGQQAFTAVPETMITWVELPGNNRAMTEVFEGKDYLEGIFKKNISRSIFSENLVSSYLLELSKKIDTAPQNAKLGVSEGRVVVTTPAKKGQTLEIQPSVATIIAALEKKETEAELTVTSKAAEVSEENLASLGLSELLSVGYSNFAGSPANRIHNIKTGTAKFNGVLIKPNEKFSFNTVLGPVDGEHGFLPELVIKENKTIPEYGGGMCQVSSTAFRAALNAGLPILERKAHAYPVQYYKPFGVDASIYLPRPDLVFRNDTGKYIFIQTNIIGSRLSFDFYGTKPSRSVSFAGSQDGAGAVEIVEKVTPAIWDQEARGKGSFSAAFYRFVKDFSGKVIKTDNFVSKYDSPDKYPH